MIKVDFSAADLAEIKNGRYDHPHPRVRRRLEVLWLKSQNLSHSEICRLAQVGETTLARYLGWYCQGGLQKTKELRFRKPESELQKYTEQLKSYFREHPPATVKEAMAKIEEITGLKRSEVTIGHFLKRIGMHPRKVGMIPSKADPDKQNAFKENKLEPRLKEAKEGKRAVLFIDAAHFVLAPFLGILWTFARIFIKAPSGRKRFNVLGALDAITHQLIMVTNDTYINAESVCVLLREIKLQYCDIPITLVLDNARYQYCKLVIELAATLDIELLFLPAYSPNLNLIERLWKFVKKQVLYSKYYSNFTDFKQAIIVCLNQTTTTHKKELDSLLTLRFQTFKKYSL
jgi:transposase